MNGDRFVMISQSGRRRMLGETNSAGQPTTRADAEQIAAELGFTLAYVSAACDDDRHDACHAPTCVCACHILFGINDHLDDRVDLPAGA